MEAKKNKADAFLFFFLKKNKIRPYVYNIYCAWKNIYLFG